METIYFLTNEQTEALKAVNTQSATFVPCWYSVNGMEGVAVEQSTLDNPSYAAHKSIFNNFDPLPSGVEITINDK